MGLRLLLKEDDMLTVVDRKDNRVIQKVTTPKRVFYQVGVPGNADTFIEFETLAAARISIEKVIEHPTRVTTPKSAYPQNNKV